MELKDILSLAILFLGVVATIVAAFVAYKSKNAADRSADAADRSADTADRSANAADRSADAADRSARNEKDAMQLQKKLESVKIVTQSLKEYVSDEEMKVMFYKIEYKEFYYDEVTRFRDPSDEYKLDKLLSHFATVALAWDRRLIYPADLVIVEYYVLRIMDDASVLRYVAFLHDWVRSLGIDRHPFEVLVDLSDFLKKNPPDGDK